jgi:alpha-glucosidase
MRDKPLTADYVRANLAGLEENFPPGYWVCNTLNNHDGTRAYDRYTDGNEHSDAQMRLALATILTLPGTPVIYNGEEIGMTDYPPQNEDQVRDYLALVVRDIEREHGTDEASIWESIKRLSRDRCRTPVQWENAPNGGFSPSKVKPWLPVNPNYAKGINVAEQDEQTDSLLNFYRRLIALRQNSAALVSGDFREISAADDPFIAFTRTFEDQTALVIINYSADAQTVETGFGDGLQVIWPQDRATESGMLKIGAYEFLIAFV